MATGFDFGELEEQDGVDEESRGIQGGPLAGTRSCRGSRARHARGAHRFASTRPVVGLGESRSSA
eukprot:15430371-Alexandrium_andersonii.AAC.1